MSLPKEFRRTRVRIVKLMIVDRPRGRDRFLPTASKGRGSELTDMNLGCEKVKLGTVLPPPSFHWTDGDSSQTRRTVRAEIGSGEHPRSLV